MDIQMMEIRDTFYDSICKVTILCNFYKDKHVHVGNILCPVFLSTANLVSLCSFFLLFLFEKFLSFGSFLLSFEVIFEF